MRGGQPCAEAVHESVPSEALFRSRKLLTPLPPTHSSSVASSWTGKGAPSYRNGMNVVLMHKPRGSKGLWYPIDQGDFIRVTKGKGKRLKLEVRANTNINSSSNDFRVSLVVDGTQLVPAGGEGGLVVESIRTVPSCSDGTTAACVTEVLLKLSRLSRRISIIVHAKTTDSVAIEARSIEFSAHNNGKERYTSLSPSILTPSSFTFLSCILR